jgi:leucyl aminopeptidase
MRVTASAASGNNEQADAWVVGVYQHNDSLRLATNTTENELLPPPLCELLQQLWEEKEFSGKVGECFRIPGPTGLDVRQLLLVGLGPQKPLAVGSLVKAYGSAAKILAEKPRRRVVVETDPDWSSEFLESAVSSMVVGCQGQDLYRAEKKLHPFEELCWRTDQGDVVDRGSILGASVNLTRRLVNEPPNQMYPASFTRIAREVCQDTGVELEAWDLPRLEEEECGALLGVAQGSDRPPYLLIMRYQGGPPDQAPLALAGKGVTFDSGGYSLKPSDGMKTMKCDMAGAATVLGAMEAIARLKLPVNIIGLVGLVENMVSGSAFKLGDVLTARSGKTIEILNTDAEGRLVLADVLDVACNEDPGALIDLATLTGACVVALGTNVTGLMTNHAEWASRVEQAAEACGEPVWELPMFEEFGEQIRSAVADIKNIGEGRWGGAITAAKFLEEFVRGRPWVHLDIAGPAFLDSPQGWLDAGGSGAMVRTLVEVARRWTGSLNSQ